MFFKSTNNEGLYFMKRFICLAVLAAVSASAGICAISTKDMTNSTYMDNQGYSEETIRLVNDHIYKPKETRDEESRVYNFWKRLYSYYDPAQDNGQFGHNKIRFNNNWDDI